MHLSAGRANVTGDDCDRCTSRPGDAILGSWTRSRAEDRKVSQKDVDSCKTKLCAVRNITQRQHEIWTCDGDRYVGGDLRRTVRRV